MTGATTHLVAFPPMLDVPALMYMPSYIDALKEGFVRGIGLPMSADEIAAIEEDPQRYLDKLLGPKSLTQILPDGQTVPRVPSTLLWLVEGKTFIGEISIRHQLSKHLENMGGHIGYGITPSQRGKGYGVKSLKLALKYCKDNLDIAKVLLTVDETNIGSRRIIEICNGELASRGPHPYKDGTNILRYWINTDEQ